MRIQSVARGRADQAADESWNAFLLPVVNSPNICVQDIADSARIEIVLNCVILEFLRCVTIKFLSNSLFEVILRVKFRVNLKFQVTSRLITKTSRKLYHHGDNHENVTLILSSRRQSRIHHPKKKMRDEKCVMSIRRGVYRPILGKKKIIRTTIFFFIFQFKL